MMQRWKSKSKGAIRKANAHESLLARVAAGDETAIAQRRATLQSKAAWQMAARLRHFVSMKLPALLEAANMVTELEQSEQSEDECERQASHAELSDMASPAMEELAGLTAAPDVCVVRISLMPLSLSCLPHRSCLPPSCLPATPARFEPRFAGCVCLRDNDRPELPSPRLVRAIHPAARRTTTSTRGDALLAHAAWAGGICRFADRVGREGAPPLGPSIPSVAVVRGTRDAKCTLCTCIRVHDPRLPGGA